MLIYADFLASATLNRFRWFVGFFCLTRETRLGIEDPRSSLTRLARLSRKRKVDFRSVCKTWQTWQPNPCKKSLYSPYITKQQQQQQQQQKEK